MNGWLNALGLDGVMTKKKYTISKLSLSNDYFNFIWIVSRGVLITVFLVIYMSFSSLQKELDDSLNQTENNIINFFQEVVQRNQNVLMYFVRQIISEGATEPDHIERILKNISAIDFQGTLYRTNVTWLSLDHKVLASSFMGASLKGVRVPEDFCAFADEILGRPMEIHISPFIKNSIFPPYKPMVHMSLWVAKNNDTPFGRISLGINLEEFSKALHKHLPPTSNRFLILDRGMHLVMSSSEFKEFYGKAISIDSLTGQILSKEFHDLKHTHLKPIKGTPFYLCVGGYEDVVNRNFLQMILPKVLEICFIGFLCLLILYLYRRRFLSPIMQMASIAEKISQGKFDFKIPNQHSVEMSILAEGLNKIKDYARQEVIIKSLLEKNHNDLSKSYHIIETKNKELQSIRRELEQALKIVQNGEKAKEQFRAEILKRSNHHLDLIIEYSEVAINSLERANLPSDLMKHYLKLYRVIHDNALKLKTTTLDVLDVSYINLNQLVKESLELHQKLAYDNKTIIKSTYEESFPKILGDHTALKQVMIYLIEQSISSTPKGLVEVKTYCENEMVCIDIKDNGFSLEQKELDRILSPSSQNSLMPNLTFEGIKKIVKEHQGTLKVELKVNAGKITTVTFPAENLRISILKKESNVYPIKKAKT